MSVSFHRRHFGCSSGSEVDESFFSFCVTRCGEVLVAANRHLDIRCSLRYVSNSSSGCSTLNKQPERGFALEQT